MHVSRLALDDFRSWRHCVVDLAPGLNVLVGHNGVGKTNIVESVEVLSTGSSHRVTSSVPLVRRGAGKAIIRANVDAHTYEMTIPARGANRARVDSGKSLYYRDIAGRVRCVTFSPRDQALVSGDPAGRRAFLNAVTAQLVPGYYATAQELTRTGRQRAALLKTLGRQEAERRAGLVPNPPTGPDWLGGGALPDPTLVGLETWTAQFVTLGIAVTRARARAVAALAEPFAAIYRALAGDGNGEAGLAYAPSLEEVVDCDAQPDAAADEEIRRRIGEHFQRIYPGETARGANLIGPHRDDLAITLDGVPAKEFASNGEIWTLALALRMAQFRILCGGADDGAAGGPVPSEADERPVLVLDDVFAQLDDGRRRQIIDFARQAGQVLVTVASPGDIPAGIDANVIDVERLASVDDDVFASLGITRDAVAAIVAGSGAAEPADGAGRPAAGEGE